MFIYKHFVIFGTYPNNGIINMNKNQINWKVKINSKWVLYFPILLLQKEILFISAENTSKVVTLRTLLSPLSTTLFCPLSFLIRPDVEAFTHTYGAEMVFWAASVKQKKKKDFPQCVQIDTIRVDCSFLFFYNLTLWVLPTHLGRVLLF